MTMDANFLKGQVKKKQKQIINKRDDEFLEMFFFFLKTIDYWEQLDGKAKQKFIEWMLERIPPRTPPNLTRYIQFMYTVVF